MSYLPGAPCRFSADGGYVQGCVMELFQRMIQLKWENVIKGNPNDVAVFAMQLAALLGILVFLYIGARWWCGWVCPLSGIGDIFDFIRRKMGLPHLKPSQPVKFAALVSGLSLGSAMLLFAKAYAYVDADGKFAGCKIPLYPFCKICPGQQICPVAAKGPEGYPPLPGMEWFFGFFRYGSLLLLAFFILAFMGARRLWCRFCPMGMTGGLFNKGALLSLKKDVRKCNNCGVCSEVCPMDIQSVRDAGIYREDPVQTKPRLEVTSRDVSSFDCIYCMKCVHHCPQDQCLSVEFAGKKISESKFTVEGKK